MRWSASPFAFCFFFISVVMPVGQLVVGSFFRFLGFIR